jgi:hypothetical protein
VALDLKEMSYEELDALIRAAVAERERKRTLGTAPDRADDAARDYLAALGFTDGDPWEQLFAVGYPRGWSATHDGHRWVSDISNNMTAPGADGGRWVKGVSDA